MKYTEEFLSTDLTMPQDALIDSFLKAIYEIRSEELNLPINLLEMNGDREASDLIRKSSIQGICIHTDNVKLVEDVPQHVGEILKTYNESDSVSVFRGTRLPLSNSSFNNGLIHTTPQFATSTAYAVGISNSSGGIGRLLTREGQRSGLGFIHAYQASLSTKIYKNFQFENFANNSATDTSVTLNDFKKELERFSLMEKSSFEVEYLSETNMYGNPNQKIKMSDNMQDWYDFITSRKCFETPYYEVMLPDEQPSQYTFLTNEKAEVIKLNLDNPKIKKVLEKLQGLLLRDFYEIRPLDKLSSEIEFDIPEFPSKESNQNEPQARFFSLIKQESEKLKELREHVKGMIEKCKKQTLLSEEDIEQLMSRSQMIGVADMLGEPRPESKVQCHADIERFIEDIKKKKKLIEQPLEAFLASENIVPNNSFIKVIDNIIDKLKEKNIPNDLKIKEMDTDSVMMDCMKSMCQKLNIENRENPTVEGFISVLGKFKENDLLRQHCGKPPLMEKYAPTLGFIFNKTIKQYVTINEENQQGQNTSDTFIHKKKETVVSSIVSIRKKINESPEGNLINESPNRMRLNSDQKSIRHNG